jgi:hypothetical protein
MTLHSSTSQERYSHGFIDFLRQRWVARVKRAMTIFLGLNLTGQQCDKRENDSWDERLVSNTQHCHPELAC